MRSIIDAHHHLWDLSACHYPWLMEKGVVRFFGDPAPIQRNYLVDDFRRDATGYELQGSVHVQVGVAAGDELRESAWLQTIGDETGLPSAIVAFCELDSPDAPASLARQLEFSRLRGVRQIIGRSEEEDRITGSGRLLDNARWREHLGLLGELGLSFDLQLTPGQVPTVAEVLAATPDTDVALCHCGSPWDQSPRGIEAWRAGLRLLAALPNVYCKISGLAMFDHHWSADSIRPIVESCIEIFGAHRSMFGSNFPVDKLHASYGEVWGAYEKLTASLSRQEQRLLFADTARNFYRL